MLLKTFGEKDRETNTQTDRHTKEREKEVECR